MLSIYFQAVLLTFWSIVWTLSTGNTSLFSFFLPFSNASLASLRAQQSIGPGKVRLIRSSTSWTVWGDGRAHNIPNNRRIIVSTRPSASSRAVKEGCTCSSTCKTENELKLFSYNRSSEIKSSQCHGEHRLMTTWTVFKHYMSNLALNRNKIYVCEKFGNSEHKYKPKKTESIIKSNTWNGWLMVWKLVSTHSRIHDDRWFNGTR